MAFMYGTHIIHTVKPGDTLFSIADRYESEVEMIERANALYPPFTDPYLIFPGQRLVVPKLYGQNETMYVVQPGDTITQIAQEFSSYPQLIAGISSGIQNPNYIFPNQQVRIPVHIYRIEEGDTLVSIAERTGVPLDAILQANQNRITVSPDPIYPGMLFIIPIPHSLNIVVLDPVPGSVIESGVRVQGYARAFEATVLHQIRDRNDVIVSEENFTTAQFAGPLYGAFSTSITFDREPTSSEGELWIYTRSARDGSIQDLVRLPVRFNR